MGTPLCSPEEKVKEDGQVPAASSEDVWPPREAEEDMEVTPCEGLGGPRSGAGIVTYYMWDFWQVTYPRWPSAFSCLTWDSGTKLGTTDTLALPPVLIDWKLLSGA